MNQTALRLIRLQKAEAFLTYRWPAGLRPNLETQIKLLRREIPARTMAVYNELKKTRSEPVAEIINGICQGCNGSLPQRLLHSLISKGKLACCPHCGRFLYSVEPATENDREGSENVLEVT